MDFKSIQEERKKIKSGGGNPDVIFFKDDTDTYIRLVPMKDIPEELNIGNQFVRAWVHYRSGGVVPHTSFSPKTFNQRDPVEEFVDLELRERVTKDKFKYLMNMKPTEVYITTAVERGKEEAGTKLLTLTSGQFDKLGNAIELAFKPDPPEDITDIKKGFDLTVQVIGKENSDTNFRKFNISVNVRKPKVLHSDPEVVDALLENQPDWRDAYKRYSPEQLDSFLESSMELDEGDLDAQAVNEDADSEPEDYVPEPEQDEEEIIAQAEKDFEKMVQEGEVEEDLEVALTEESDGEGEDPDMPF